MVPATQQSPLLSVVGLVASEYDNEWRGFNESGTADSINPFDSLSYLTNHQPMTLYRGIIRHSKPIILYFTS